MAYGDGFAAVVGQKYGKRELFSFAKGKTLLGSARVALVGFIVTFLSLMILGPEQKMGTTSIVSILWISLLTGILSTIMEAAGEGGCDNLTLPIGSGIFATLLFQYGSPYFYFYLAVSALILYIAYRFESITMDGVVAAILTATTLYAFGGIWIGINLLVFFILGSVVSKWKNQKKLKAEFLQGKEGVRNWKQVLCNSLPACIILWLGAFEGTGFTEVLPYCVFSAAAADTFSSEIGKLSKGRIFNIINGKSIPSGLSGGVTVLGFVAGAIGSLLLSLLAFPNFGWAGVLFVGILGFLGTVIDSLLGAIFQSKYRDQNGKIYEKNEGGARTLVMGWPFISNNVVNIATLFIVVGIGYFFL